MARFPFCQGPEKLQGRVSAGSAAAHPTQGAEWRASAGPPGPRLRGLDACRPPAEEGVTAQVEQDAKLLAILQWKDDVISRLERELDSAQEEVHTGAQGGRAGLQARILEEERNRAESAALQSRGRERTARRLAMLAAQRVEVAKENLEMEEVRQGVCAAGPSSRGTATGSLEEHLASPPLNADDIMPGVSPDVLDGVAEVLRADLAARNAAELHVIQGRARTTEAELRQALVEDHALAENIAHVQGLLADECGREEGAQRGLEAHLREEELELSRLQRDGEQAHRQSVAEAGQQQASQCQVAQSRQELHEICEELEQAVAEVAGGEASRLAQATGEVLLLLRVEHAQERQVEQVKLELLRASSEQLGLQREVDAAEDGLAYQSSSQKELESFTQRYEQEARAGSWELQQVNKDNKTLQVEVALARQALQEMASSEKVWREQIELAHSRHVEKLSASFEATQANSLLSRTGSDRDEPHRARVGDDEPLSTLGWRVRERQVAASQAVAMLRDWEARASLEQEAKYWRDLALVARQGVPSWGTIAAAARVAGLEQEVHNLQIEQPDWQMISLGEEEAHKSLESHLKLCELQARRARTEEELASATARVAEWRHGRVRAAEKAFFSGSTDWRGELVEEALAASGCNAGNPNAACHLGLMLTALELTSRLTDLLAHVDAQELCLWKVQCADLAAASAERTLALALMARQSAKSWGNLSAKVSHVPAATADAAGSGICSPRTSSGGGGGLGRPANAASPWDSMQELAALQASMSELKEQLLQREQRPQATGSLSCTPECELADGQDWCRARRRGDSSSQTPVVEELAVAPKRRDAAVQTRRASRERKREAAEAAQVEAVCQRADSLLRAQSALQAGYLASTEQLTELRGNCVARESRVEELQAAVLLLDTELQASRSREVREVEEERTEAAEAGHLERVCARQEEDEAVLVQEAQRCAVEAAIHCEQATDRRTRELRAEEEQKRASRRRYVEREEALEEDATAAQLELAEVRQDIVQAEAALEEMRLSESQAIAEAELELSEKQAVLRQTEERWSAWAHRGEVQEEGKRKRPAAAHPGSETSAQRKLTAEVQSLESAEEALQLRVDVAQAELRRATANKREEQCELLASRHQQLEEERAARLRSVADLSGQVDVANNQLQALRAAAAVAAQQAATGEHLLQRELAAVCGRTSALQLQLERLRAAAPRGPYGIASSPQKPLQQKPGSRKLHEGKLRGRRAAQQKEQEAEIRRLRDSLQREEGRSRALSNRGQSLQAEGKNLLQQKQDLQAQLKICREEAERKAAVITAMLKSCEALSAGSQMSSKDLQKQLRSAQQELTRKTALIQQIRLEVSEVQQHEQLVQQHQEMDGSSASTDGQTDEAGRRRGTTHQQLHEARVEMQTLQARLAAAEARLSGERREREVEQGRIRKLRASLQCTRWEIEEQQATRAAEEWRRSQEALTRFLAEAIGETAAASTPTSAPAAGAPAASPAARRRAPPDPEFAASLAAPPPPPVDLSVVEESMEMLSLGHEEMEQSLQMSSRQQEETSLLSAGIVTVAADDLGHLHTPPRGLADVLRAAPSPPRGMDSSVMEASLQILNLCQEDLSDFLA